MRQREKLPQKQYDKIKRAVEEITVIMDGGYSDQVTRKGIKSKYWSSAGDQFTQVWHKSYSDNRSIKNLQSNVIRQLECWGIERKAIRAREGFKMLSSDNVLEKIVLEKTYSKLDYLLKIIEREVDYKDVNEDKKNG